MDKELIKLIEENGLTLHGDIEFFAHLVAEREREACADICDEEAKWATEMADRNGAGAAAECGYKIRTRERN